MQETEIIYIADPMCSWCWGFAPVVRQIHDEFEDAATFRLILGGLRPGPQAEKMDRNLKAYIRSHWKHVEETSGQPFNFDFFERSDFLYDTEPASRAVVTVRRLAPSLELGFFHTLQRAFYADNIDITDENSYHPLLESCRIDPKAFHDFWSSNEAREATLADFEEANGLGIRGFPSLVLKNGDVVALLTRGYQPFENLQPHIVSFFRMRA